MRNRISLTLATGVALSLMTASIAPMSASATPLDLRSEDVVGSGFDPVPVRPPAQSQASKRFRHGIAGQVRISGKPVRRARISVSTLNGAKIKVIGSSRRTNRFGRFQLFAPKQPPKKFVVTAKGGRFGDKALGNTRLQALGRGKDPMEFVNMASTLLVRYHDQHHQMKLAQATKITSRYLGLPKTGKVYSFGQYGHVLSAAHDPGYFYRVANKRGGVNRYVNQQARRVSADRRVRPSLQRLGFRIAPMGTGSPLFSARTPRSGEIQAEGILADLGGQIEQMLEGALTNTAVSAACAEATSGLAQAMLNCSATQNQAAQIESQLANIQSSITSLEQQVQGIGSDLDQGNWTVAFKNAGIANLKTILNHLQGYMGVMTNGVPSAAGPVCGQSGSTGNQTAAASSGFGSALDCPPKYVQIPLQGSSMSDWVTAVCNAAYPAGVANGANTATKSYSIVGSQSPQSACAYIGNYLLGTSADSPAGGSVFVQLTTFFEYFTGQEILATPNQILALAGESVLSSGGQVMIQGAKQNGLNQYLGSLVGMQESLGAIAVAWMSFWETWTLGAPQFCSTPPSATTGTSFAPSSGTSCEVAQALNYWFSVEDYIASNGARAAVPSEYQKFTQGAATTPSGVVIDTVGSTTNPNMWFALAVDVSGQLLEASAPNNAYWPYVYYGQNPGTAIVDSTTGSTIGHGPSTTVNPGANPRQVGAILPDYPGDSFALDQTPATAQQLAADALEANPKAANTNSALTDQGFIGPGADSLDAFGNGVDNWTFNWSSSVSESQCDQVAFFPGTSMYFTPTGYSCADGSTAYSVDLQGTFSTSYIPTNLGRNATSQLCATTTAQPAGSNPAPKGEDGEAELCLGEQASSGSLGGATKGIDGYYSFYLDVSPGQPVWTQDVFSAWQTLSTVPTYITKAPPPPVVPSPPTNVSATQEQNSLSANVSWQAPSNRGSFPVTSYTATATDTATGDTVGTCTAQASATSCVVADVPGTMTFSVTATSGAGTSLPSVASDPLSVSGLPTSPLNVTATQTGQGTISVQWTAPTSSGAPISGYTATAYGTTFNLEQGSADGTCTATPPATSCTVSGLADQFYAVSVTATNSYGSGPVSAGSIVAVGSVPPGVPTNVVAVAGKQQATVTWNPPAASAAGPVQYYQLLATPADMTAYPALSWDVPSNAYTASIPYSGAVYSFQVYAVNYAGFGGVSAKSNSVTIG